MGPLGTTSTSLSSVFLSPTLRAISEVSRTPPAKTRGREDEEEELPVSASSTGLTGADGSVDSGQWIFGLVGLCKAGKWIRNGTKYRCNRREKCGHISREDGLCHLSQSPTSKRSTPLMVIGESWRNKQRSESS
ncbi:unnamed protein product [Microthlaspi erraticum]|uniref:Uncharacterized protein n=1 Tax=Microthlaspi erraticum TaxID=1685480 RepID=A0A6D2JHF5_9BRAS|nr:unnamed protein product [Microthlaspi erraticum]